MRFIKKIQNFAYQNNLLDRGSKIIVAVSGGPDSTCLMHVLLELSKKYDFKLHIVHVNYHLRGVDSDKDEAFVRKLGATYNMPVTVYNVKNALIKRNSEENLRNKRYAFFESLRKKLEFDLIAVAHTKDDQAETVLMRIIRGTGLEGLAAMRPKNGYIARPLLGSSRKEIMAYLKEKKFSYRTDKTNKQSLYFRNKIRNKLIPYLEKNFSPAIKEALVTLATSAAHDFDFSMQNCQNFIFKETGAEIDVHVLQALHESQKAALARRMIRAVKGDLRGITSGHINEILKIVKSNKNKRQKMSFCGLNLERIGDKVRLYLYK